MNDTPELTPDAKASHPKPPFDPRYHADRMALVRGRDAGRLLDKAAAGQISYPDALNAVEKLHDELQLFARFAPDRADCVADEQRYIAGVIDKIRERIENPPPPADDDSDAPWNQD